MLHKWIYKAGVALRNPSLWRYYAFLKESETWPLERLQAYQLDKLREFLRFAGEHSPHYKRLFARTGFDPGKIEKIDDLRRLPTVGKEELIEHAKEIRTDFPFKKLRVSETSGTTGSALRFERNEEWDSAHRAAMFRGYSWYGVHPWERNGYFWGYNTDPAKRRRIRFEDLLQNRFRIFSYDSGQIEAFVRELRRGARFVSGYSSMIYEVAKAINRSHAGVLCELKMVKGTSEKIYESYQLEVMKAFGRKMVSEYGAAEAGIIAFECPEGGHMHITMENVIVEQIDGQIVVTNLVSRSFPIIRYRLGDSINLAPEGFRCPCGRAHPVIFDVLGRVGKKVVGQRNSYPSLTFYYVFKNLGLERNIVLNYQACQQTPGHITLRIEQNLPQYTKPLEEELAKYFGDDIRFTIRWGEELHAKEGKLRDFVSTLE